MIYQVDEAVFTKVLDQEGTMIAIDIALLRTLAQQAKPMTKSEAEFYTACSPTTVLALLDMLARQREALKKHGTHSDYCPAKPHLNSLGLMEGGVCVCGLNTALSQGEIL